MTERKPRYRNQLDIQGNMEADPIVKDVRTGRVCNFKVATPEYAKDKDNPGKFKLLHTEWHKVVVWNEDFITLIEQSVRKGDLVSLTGKVKTRKWSAQDGNDRYTTEVVVDWFGSFELVEKSRGNGGATD